MVPSSAKQYCHTHCHNCENKTSQSTQTPTDREADLDLDVKLGFDNTSQRLFLFCFFAWCPPEYWKETFPCISFRSLLDFSPPKSSISSIDGSFGSCLSRLRCFTVSPICSDYRRTERTGCSTAWLCGTNWTGTPPAPQAPAVVLEALCYFRNIFLCFYLPKFHSLPGNPSHHVKCNSTCTCLINRKSVLAAEESRRACICAGGSGDRSRNTFQ